MKDLLFSMKFYNTSILRGLMYEVYFPEGKIKGSMGFEPTHRFLDLTI